MIGNKGQISHLHPYSSTILKIWWRSVWYISIVGLQWDC